MRGFVCGSPFGSGFGTTTLYVPMAEIRDLGGSGEELVHYPHPDVRVVVRTSDIISYLDRDHRKRPLTTLRLAA